MLSDESQYKLKHNGRVNNINIHIVQTLFHNYILFLFSLFIFIL